MYQVCGLNDETWSTNQMPVDRILCAVAIVAVDHSHCVALQQVVLIARFFQEAGRLRTWHWRAKTSRLLFFADDRVYLPNFLRLN